MSHQNISHHCISEAASTGIKGLIKFESSKMNTSKDDILAPLKLMAELQVTSLGTGSHLRHLPWCDAL